MEYNTTIGEYNFTVVQGNTWQEVFWGWTVDGDPLDLTTISEIRADFRKDPKYKGAPDLSLTVANGGLKVTATELTFNFGVNTLSLSGIYEYDILMIIAGERQTYVRGKMNVKPVITK